MRPRSSSVDGAEGAGQLEWGSNRRGAFKGSGWNQLPATLAPTATKCRAAAARTHPFEKSMNTGSFAVRLIPKMFFHEKRIIAAPEDQNQGEFA